MLSFDDSKPPHVGGAQGGVLEASPGACDLVVSEADIR